MLNESASATLNACLEVIIKYEKFDPEAILSKSNLDPNDFRFKWSKAKRNRVLNVSYKGQMILLIAIKEWDERLNPYYVIFVEPMKGFDGDPNFFKGKGVGKIAYAVTLWLAHKDGVIVTNDYNDGYGGGLSGSSPENSRVWYSLQRYGLAQKPSFIPNSHIFVPMIDLTSVEIGKWNEIEKFISDKTEFAEFDQDWVPE